MEVDIVNSEGKVSGKTVLPESIGQVKIRPHLVHEVLRGYLANQRKGTHSSLTRSEVKGGGKKPWKQKHTGRARAGTTRSPLWRGGGIIFGPKPRSYRIDLPHSKVRSALSQVLNVKAKNGDLIISEKPQLENRKTKKVVEWLKKLSLPQKSILVVEKKDEQLSLASRNLKFFKVMERNSLHPYHILNAQKVIFTSEAFNGLEVSQSLGKEGRSSSSRTL